MSQSKRLIAGLSFIVYVIDPVAAPANETQTFKYDELGRLVDVSYSGTINNGQRHSICYDATDNRTRYRSDPSGAGASCPSTVIVPPPPPPAPPPPAPPPPPPPPPNNPPVANTDAVTVKVCLGTSKNVIANDTDPDGDYPLSVTAVGTSTWADVYIIDQSTIGVAAYGAPGSGVVTYTITDSRGASASGYLNITVQNGTGCQ